MFEIEKKFLIPSKVSIEVRLKPLGFYHKDTLDTRSIYLLSGNPLVTNRLVVSKKIKEDDLDGNFEYTYILGTKRFEEVCGGFERWEQEEKVTKFVADFVLKSAGTNVLNLYKTRYRWRLGKTLPPSKYERVNVDIDEVVGLGTYAEVEVIAKTEAEVEAAKAIVEEVSNMLGLTEEVTESYLDLLKEKSYNLHNFSRKFIMR